MPKSAELRPGDVFSITGTEIIDIYQKNRMAVHFQGMSKTLQFPQTVALQGAPTCSVGISPHGLYNRLNDAGRLILLCQKAVQFGSVPYIRVGEQRHLLTSRKPQTDEAPDDIPAIENYYPDPVAEHAVTLNIATPLMEMVLELEQARVIRRLISPFLSGNEQVLFPVGVEEYEIENTSQEALPITLVVPRPSLVNLQEKELKPTDQDSVYLSTAALKGHRHQDFRSAGMRGVVMASTETPNRMVLAVPESSAVVIDTQPYFSLNRYVQELLLNEDGSFYQKPEPCYKRDYGAALSLSFTLAPGETMKLPVAVVLDFPEQHYVDGVSFERKYTKSFPDGDARALDLARIALHRYPEWWRRTIGIQQRMIDFIQKSPAYQRDRAGALRLTRLMLNEFHFPLSNAAVWVQDKSGQERARFLECFDYAYINPSDVDWYSMLLLFLFPGVEKELCQRFVDSIVAEDPSQRYYHVHSSFVEARQHFEAHPEEYQDVSLTQIRDAFKVKGSVAHDVGAMPKGHPLRNVSDYAWYNNNYWVDLFPKLALRVLRNLKFTGDLDFLKQNWEKLKYGLAWLKQLDFDGDGIPEGYPDEVKNTFDNLTLFGADAYDATHFLAGCQAMMKMAQMMHDEPAREECQEAMEKARANLEKLWREGTNQRGQPLRYYVTCYDPETGKTNTDVWTNQLDALWYLISIGEEPFISDDRARDILQTIYRNNRTHMGWAMARTENGEAVESEQGQDVYTTSNYVFAQLLHYYGLVEESKEVYRHMDRVVFQYGNSLITPDNLRADLELEAGESAPGPHYIVAAYPRPGAVFTHLVLEHIKELQARQGSRAVEPESLQALFPRLFGDDAEGAQSG